MADHGARGHSTWAASATNRNWNCSGALAMADRIKTPEKENKAAAWGTACHQVSEKCLRSGKDAIEFLDTEEKTKEHTIEVDEELAETAQVYVDYVRKRTAEAQSQGSKIVNIEQHFSLAALNPPFDAGGTGDCVIYFPVDKMLEIIDLKGGRGVVVEVTGNKQGRSYGLGAMLANHGLDVDKVKVTIVQPRAPHKDGRTRSETFHVADLVEWTTDLMQKMHRARKALADRKTMSEPEWNREYLVAGDHCEFCPAAGFCPELARKAQDATRIWFDDLDQPRLSNAPDSLDPGELAKTLDMADMITEWVNAVRAFAHSQAEMGTEIPNYVLVPKQGREKWNEGAEAHVMFAMNNSGLPRSKWLNEKLKTPKQIRKALGKKRENVVKDMSFTPSEGTNLVRADKTTRQAVAPAVSKFFAPIS